MDGSLYSQIQLRMDTAQRMNPNSQGTHGNHGYTTEKTIYTLDCLVSIPVSGGDTSLNTAKRLGSTMVTWKTICYHLTKPRTNTAYLPDIPPTETHVWHTEDWPIQY